MRTGSSEAGLCQVPLLLLVLVLKAEDVGPNSPFQRTKSRVPGRVLAPTMVEKIYRRSYHLVVLESANEDWMSA